MAFLEILNFIHLFPTKEIPIRISQLKIPTQPVALNLAITSYNGSHTYLAPHLYVLVFLFLMCTLMQGPWLRYIIQMYFKRGETWVNFCSAIMKEWRKFAKDDNAHKKLFHPILIALICCLRTCKRGKSNKHPSKSFHKSFPLKAVKSLGYLPLHFCSKYTAFAKLNLLNI